MIIHVNILKLARLEVLSLETLAMLAMPTQELFSRRILTFLMNMTQKEMYGANVGNHYAQAWSMIHFFLRADRGDGECEDEYRVGEGKPEANRAEERRHVHGAS